MLLQLLPYDGSKLECACTVSSHSSTRTCTRLHTLVLLHRHVDLNANAPEMKEPHAPPQACVYSRVSKHHTHKNTLNTIMLQKGHVFGHSCDVGHSKSQTCVHCPSSQQHKEEDAPRHTSASTTSYCSQYFHSCDKCFGTPQTPLPCP